MDGPAAIRSEETLNPNNGGPRKEEEAKPKVVVIMGPTGSGKSKLAIDLASHFPIEIINSDSMQVYRGLDVLTNKVPLHEQKGVKHHLLGTVSPDVEFTVKDFRNAAIPLIMDIFSRNCLPVIVGGTNYYIQALVSQFLLDDSAEEMDESCLNHPPGDVLEKFEPDFARDSSNYNYGLLKDIDPVAANRIHPNNHRKINQYLGLYARSGVLPSKLYQGKDLENWGQVHNFRFNCCFICVDAATPVLDHYVEQRVDCMIDSGLLNEVYDIYNLNADYTKGLRQAIGVREFENFLEFYLSNSSSNKPVDSNDDSMFQIPKDNGDKVLKEKMRAILNSPRDNKQKILLEEAINKVKLNTRRLVHRQKRRVNRLQTFFGWNIHYVDATEYVSRKSDESWVAQVVEPAVMIIKSFLNENLRSVFDLEAPNSAVVEPVQRDLWTQYVCQACGGKILRGSHEWEEHKRGHRHRKRISRLKKAQAQGVRSAE